MTEKISNQEYAKGLREIADFYEKNSEMVQAVLSYYSFGKEEFLNAFRVLCNGGKVEKDMGDSKSEFAQIRISRDFSGVPLHIFTSKDTTCKKIVSWECPDSLLEMAMNMKNVELAEEKVENKAEENF